MFRTVSHYFVSSDGVTLRYTSTPGGKRKRWFILLHGLGGDVHSWNIIQQLLFEKGYPSIALDLRGHGLSERPDKVDGYKLDQLAQDVTLLIEHTGITDAVLVGHCFGGMIAMYLASYNPPQVKGLILIDTSYESSFLGLRIKVPKSMVHGLRMFAYALPNNQGGEHAPYTDRMLNKDWSVTRLLADIASTTLKSYLLCCSEAFSFDASKLIRRIAVPTLVIAGTDDSIFPPEVVSQLADRIKNAQYKVVQGANHIIVLTKPYDLVEKILSIFDML